MKANKKQNKNSQKSTKTDNKKNKAKNMKTTHPPQMIKIKNLKKEKREEDE